MAKNILEVELGANSIDSIKLTIKISKKNGNYQKQLPRKHFYGL